MHKAQNEVNEVKFTFKNIGVIDSAEVVLNDMTIFVGKNSVSKTYLTYLIWGFLDFIPRYIRLAQPIFFRKYLVDSTGQLNKSIDLSELANRFEDLLASLSRQYQTYAYRVLSVDKDSDIIKNFTFKAEVNSLKFDYDSYKTINFNVSGGINVTVVKKDTNILELITISENDAPINNNKIIDAIADKINASLLSFFLNQIFPPPFIITSERTGISIFYKELDTRRNALVTALVSENKNIFQDFDNIRNHMGNYPVPVSINMDFVREIFDHSKNKTKLENANAKLLKKNLAEISNGKYSFDKAANQIFFHSGIGENSVKIPINVSSSSIKSLMMLDAYVNHIAAKGQILVIDEPELNLHPDNQRKIARLLALLVNSGVKILFTTHSDYIIKELNNLIMLYGLSQNNQETALKEIKKANKTIYDPSMFLNPDQVTCIMIQAIGKGKKDKSVEAVKTKDNKYGINATIIDDEINSLGEVSDILYDLYDEISDDRNDK